MAPLRAWKATLAVAMLTVALLAGAASGTLDTLSLSSARASASASAHQHAAAALGENMIREMVLKDGVAKDSAVDMIMSLLRNMKRTLVADYKTDHTEYTVDFVACTRNKTALQSIIALSEPAAAKTTDEEFDITLGAVEGSVVRFRDELKSSQATMASVRSLMHAREVRVTDELGKYEMRVAEHRNALHALSIIRAKLRRVRGFGADDELTAQDKVVEQARGNEAQSVDAKAHAAAHAEVAPILVEMQSYRTLGAASGQAGVVSGMMEELAAKTAPAMVATPADRAVDVARLLTNLKKALVGSLSQLVAAHTTFTDKWDAERSALAQQVLDMEGVTQRLESQLARHKAQVAQLTGARHVARSMRNKAKGRLAGASIKMEDLDTRCEALKLGHDKKRQIFEDEHRIIHDLERYVCFCVGRVTRGERE
jgi:hypothetical protein